MEIRELKQEDMMEAMKLKALCWPEELAGLSNNKLDINEEYEFWDDWMMKADKCNDVRVLVGAFEKEKMLGVAFGSFIESKDAPKEGMELNGLWVYPKQRGRGISLILMQKIAEVFLSQSCGRMVVYNFHKAPSNKFYRHLGFSVFNTEYQMEGKLPVDIFSIDLKELNETICEKLRNYNIN
ncbi:GNAT family N-acetyltransferase [Clostridium senegalense]